jgi:hypothetical protein
MGAKDDSHLMYYIPGFWSMTHKIPNGKDVTECF